MIVTRVNSRNSRSERARERRPSTRPGTTPLRLRLSVLQITSGVCIRRGISADRVIVNKQRGTGRRDLHCERSNPRKKREIKFNWRQKVGVEARSRRPAAPIVIKIFSVIAAAVGASGPDLCCNSDVCFAAIAPAALPINVH